MNGVFLLSLLVLGTVTALLMVYFFRMKKNNWQHKTNYNSLFILGICMMPLGITLDMPIFFLIGMAYIAIGLINKDKKLKMSKQQRKMQTIGVVVGLAILAIFVASIFIFGQVL